MKRMVALGASALLLAGCALPVPVQIASWALDGLSYIATQKSVADHGISVVAQKDCAVLRGLLSNGELCRDFDDAATVLASGGAEGGFAAFGEGTRRALTDADDVARLGEPEDGPVLAAAEPGFDVDALAAIADFETAAGLTSPAASADPTPTAPQPQASESDFALPAEAADAGAETETAAGDWQARTTRIAAKTAKGEPAAGLYFVIGSFREHANARALRNRYRILTPAVLAAKLDRGMVFRVVVGPFDQGQAKRIHQRIYDAGISDSWAIRVKPGEWSMAMVDPPAEAPQLAELSADGRGWDPMTYVRMLAALLY